MDEEGVVIPQNIMVQVIEVEPTGRFHVKPAFKDCFLRKLGELYPDEEGWADYTTDRSHGFASIEDNVEFYLRYPPNESLLEVLGDPKHPDYQDAKEFLIASIVFRAYTEDEGAAAARAIKECVKETVTAPKVEKKFFEKVGEQKGLDPYMTSSYAKDMFGKSRKRKSKKAKKTRRRRRRV
jgi:hypothetical protein